MDEYIKREEALEIVIRTGGDYASAFSEIRKLPTANVVPRAEIEQLQHKYDLAVAEREANVKGFTEDLSKVKTEVAKEIIGEIENISITFPTTVEVVIDKLQTKLAELKAKYKEEKK